MTKFVGDRISISLTPFQYWCPKLTVTNIDVTGLVLFQSKKRIIQRHHRRFHYELHLNNIISLLWLFLVVCIHFDVSKHLPYSTNLLIFRKSEPDHPLSKKIILPFRSNVGDTFRMLVTSLTILVTNTEQMSSIHVTNITEARKYISVLVRLNLV